MPWAPGSLARTPGTGVGLRDSVRIQKLRRTVCACALTAGVFVFAGEVPRAAASTVTVNTALDIAPSVDVNGNTNYPNDGLCSLRAAIFVVASNTNAADVARLDQLYADHRVVSDRTVDSHVKNLRRKLSDANPELELIRAIYGVGYRLEL